MKVNRLLRLNNWFTILWISVFQSILFFVFVQLIFILYQNLAVNFQSDISWGVSIYYSYWIFLIICLISNVLTSLFKNPRLILIIVFSLFILYWIAPSKIYPYRSAMILILAATLYISGYYLKRKINNKTSE